MSDLIERLKKESRDLHEWAHLGNGGEPAELTANLIDEAIEALSPALPDDVKLQIQIARDKHAYMLARKPEFGPPDEITANFIGELADLLERQARENAQLRDACGNNQQSIVMVRNHYEQRIEQLEAALKDAQARLRATVDAQAEDDGLWFVAETAAEAYLQQELRKLHAQIEALQENEL